MRYLFYIVIALGLPCVFILTGATMSDGFNGLFWLCLIAVTAIVGYAMERLAGT